MIYLYCVKSFYIITYWIFRPPLPEKVNGTELPDPMYESPDYRLEEESWFPYNAYMFLEEERPYRFSPFFKQLYRWERTYYYQKVCSL